MKGQALALVGMLGSLWTAKQNLRSGFRTDLTRRDDLIARIRKIGKAYLDSLRFWRLRCLIGAAAPGSPVLLVFLLGGSSWQSLELPEEEKSPSRT